MQPAPARLRRQVPRALTPTGPAFAACVSSPRASRLLQPFECDGALPVTPRRMSGKTGENHERHAIGGPYEPRIAAHREKGPDTAHQGTAGCTGATRSRTERAAGAVPALRRSAMALRSFNMV